MACRDVGASSSRRACSAPVTPISVSLAPRPADTSAPSENSGLRSFPLGRLDAKLSRQALCDLTYEVPLAVVDFLQQRIAAIRRGPDRRIVETGPDFNLQKEHLDHPTINPAWAAFGKNDVRLGFFRSGIDELSSACRVVPLQRPDPSGAGPGAPCD
jgi:hypothetical protein